MTPPSPARQSIETIAPIEAIEAAQPGQIGPNLADSNPAATNPTAVNPTAVDAAGLAFEPVAIRLSHVSKTFGGQTVVWPFSLDIPAGKKVALLGPSGCGKTTTLRLIAGLESPDPGGRVFFGGQDVTDVPVEKRRVGMVFQHFALFPHLSVEENVAYGLRAQRKPKTERRQTVERMLAMVKLSDQAKRGVESLSGGQKQRVALARALASGPRVLLLDEPLAALDAILRVSLREELDELLSRLGVTTVMVTHDQDEAMALGDQIVVMKDGRIEQSGTPQEIYRRPKTSFVASFVGGSNHLPGRLDGDFLRLPGSASIPIAALKIGGAPDPALGQALGQDPDPAPDSAPNPALGSAPNPSTGSVPVPALGLAGSPAFGFASSEPPLLARPGGEVIVYFRPDKPTLAPVEPGRMRGTVVSRRFVGQKTRLVVRLYEEITIKLELPNSSHSPGETVGVHLPPEELLVFAPTP
ncbi:MAG: ATP-binding cassette domain-containing protein [Deltaproteobacteria bacterium]|jgi:putative spermidine/putrescine transport system ATP-binding protein|nr:ATP-binding cassette domain-containing protein [Deltaproteobacteria bacterium]